MTKVSLLLSLACLFSSTSFARQKASCWPKQNAVSQRVILSDDQVQSIPVVDSGFRPEESRTLLHLIPEKSGHQLVMKFRENFWEVGSPQNVYAVMILSDRGEPIYFEDYTGGCMGPGLSFFPSHEVNLLFLKKSALPSKLIHILVWSQ